MFKVSAVDYLRIIDKLTIKLYFSTRSRMAECLNAFEFIHRVLHICETCFIILEDETNINKILHLNFIFIHSKITLLPIAFLSLRLLKNSFEEIS